MTSHRSPDHALEFRDLQRVEQSHLDIDHLRDGNRRKRLSERSTRRGVAGRRAGRPATPAKTVRADDKELIRVYRAAWSDQRFPPAGLERQPKFLSPRLIQAAQHSHQQLNLVELLIHHIYIILLRREK